MHIRIGNAASCYESHVPSLWETVRRVRLEVAERLVAHAPEFRDAVALAAGELAENLVKYAEETPDDEPAVIDVEVLATRVRIRTNNPFTNVSRAERVVAIVEQIRQHPDPGALYADAIEARLRQGSESGSQQGLYRLAAVAGFSLRASIENGRLIIEAERTIG